MGTGSTASAPLEPEGKNAISKISSAVPEGGSLRPETVAAAVSSTLVLADTSLNASPPSTQDSALQNSEPPIAPLLSLVDPFVGFVGHSFLYLCRLVEMIGRWTKPSATPAALAAESLLQSSSHASFRYWGACSRGTIYCTLTAAGLIPVFYATSIKSFLPFAFLMVIVMVAARFGRAAGVLGTLIAAFLFAYYLFEPAGLAVSDPASKNHLIWMVVIGVVISDLLARFRARRMSAHRF